MEFSQNVCFAHLQLLMNTSTKYPANWTETVGEIFQTRLGGQTDPRPPDRPTDRQADSSIPPLPNFICRGIMSRQLKIASSTMFPLSFSNNQTVGAVHDTTLQVFCTQTLINRQANNKYTPENILSAVYN